MEGAQGGCVRGDHHSSLGSIGREYEGLGRTGGRIKNVNCPGRETKLLMAGKFDERGALLACSSLSLTAFIESQRQIQSVALDYGFVVPSTAAMAIECRARHGRVAV